jgi:hypothetical protein
MNQRTLTLTGPQINILAELVRVWPRQPNAAWDRLLRSLEQEDRLIPMAEGVGRDESMHQENAELAELSKALGYGKARLSEHGEAES